ncbi:hypothetical protein AP060_00044 [Pseudomonas sp. TAD18]|nr:hypothetical protein AP059_00042 [Pseudomonas sp. TAA207]KVV12920.1 hypothetical protein AP060_00044 [Pseudomonas sp. TAD18]
MPGAGHFVLFGRDRSGVGLGDHRRIDDGVYGLIPAIRCQPYHERAECFQYAGFYGFCIGHIADLVTRSPCCGQGVDGRVIGSRSDSPGRFGRENQIGDRITTVTDVLGNAFTAHRDQTGRGSQHQPCANGNSCCTHRCDQSTGCGCHQCRGRRCVNDALGNDAQNFSPHRGVDNQVPCAGSFDFVGHESVLLTAGCSWALSGKPQRAFDRAPVVAVGVGQ